MTNCEWNNDSDLAKAYRKFMALKDRASYSALVGLMRQLSDDSEIPVTMTLSEAASAICLFSSMACRIVFSGGEAIANEWLEVDVDQTRPESRKDSPIFVRYGVLRKALAAATYINIGGFCLNPWHNGGVLVPFKDEDIDAAYKETIESADQRYEKWLGILRRWEEHATPRSGLISHPGKIHVLDYRRYVDVDGMTGELRLMEAGDELIDDEDEDGGTVIWHHVLQRWVPEELKNAEMWVDASVVKSHE